ncbi:MAG: hypothetical protein RLN85_01380, partial [Pseudomonadales bacterium]
MHLKLSYLSRRITLTSVILLIRIIGFGQTQCDGIFSGSIQDEAGNPLVGAAIVLDPSGKGMVTDFNGAFELR